MIENLAKKDKKIFNLWHAYGSVLKEGVAMDFENKDQIAGLLRYRSTLEDDKVVNSFQTYIDRMQSDQEHILLDRRRSSSDFTKPTLGDFSKARYRSFVIRSTS